MAFLERLVAPDSQFQKRFYFLAKRFVPGERIAQALEVVHTLNTLGMTATLDFLGEDVTLPEAALHTRDVYLEMLDAIKASGVQTNVSVKLSALGLLIDEDFARQNLESILEHALQNADPFVRIDMEGSSTTQRTLELFERVFARHTNVGPVLQAYLKRTPADLERVIALQARVRLCKGAYNEPAQIAIKDMPSIRREYLRMAQRLLQAGNYPAIATHDPRLIETLLAFAEQHAIPPDRFEFQMLYGVRPAMQRRLVAQGYRVRIYIPFGTHWAGYLYRRVLERKENALFAFSSLFAK